MSAPYEITHAGEWLVRVTYLAFDGPAAHAHVARLAEKMEEQTFREGPFDGNDADILSFDFVPLALPPCEGRRVRFVLSALTMAPLEDPTWRDAVEDSHVVVLAATDRVGLRRAHAVLADMSRPLVVALEGDAFTDADIRTVSSELGVQAVRTHAVASGENVFDVLKAVAKSALENLRAYAAIRHIVSTNLFDFEVASLTPGVEIVLSPIWELGPTGKVMRRAVVLPTSMRAHYFEGAARRILDAPEIAGIAVAMSQRPDASHRLGRLRTLYVDDDAPYVELDESWTEQTGSLSLVLADIGRHARAGMTPAQMLAGDFESPTARMALARLDELESACMDELRTTPIEGMLDALRKTPRLRIPLGATFH